MAYYHYIPKEKSIQNCIQAIWQVDHMTRFENETIIPKGIVEIIFNFSEGEAIAAAIGNTVAPLPGCFINGFNRGPVQIQLPRKQVFIGICFQPLAVMKIFGCPAALFADANIDATLVTKDINGLRDQLAILPGFDSRVAVILSWLRTRLIDWQPRELFINDFLYHNRYSTMTAKELAAALCYSPRQVTRKISEATGMNTEEMLLYKKYLRAVDLIQHTEMSLTHIALESGFSDQPHFIKSFKSFASVTPGQYRRSKSMVKGHLYTNVR